MKKILFFLAATLFLAACAKETSKPVSQARETVTYDFVVSLPSDATKAAADNDGQGASINHWVIEIRDAQNEVFYYEEKTGTKGQHTQSFPDVRLIKSQEYDILFWADNNEGSYYDVTNLTNVTITNYPGNNDATDAFSAYFKVTDGVDPGTQAITLKRSFAQVNVITNDLAFLYEKSTGTYNKYAPSELKATLSLPNTFDVRTQTAGTASSVTIEAGAAYKAPGAEQDNYQKHENPATLFMFYAFASAEESTVSSISYSMKSNGETISRTLDNIPVRANYRTNITGSFMTDSYQFEVTIDPIWSTPDYEESK